MTDTPNAEAVVLNASRVSVWVPWYFKQRLLTVVTVPLFLLLVYCLVVSLFGAFFKGVALVRASHAVFGAFAALSIGWIPLIMPAVLYYSLTKHLPGLWLRPDASTRAKVLSSIAVLMLLHSGRI